ncbi:MAG: radical SAM protein [Elusimicrobiota bacterium]
MSKILLIGLPADRYTQPMLGLGYIGAALMNKGHTIKVHDMASENCGNIAQIEKEIKEFKPDSVGISVLTAQFTKAKEIVKAIKKLDTKIITVMGGPHISALPEYTLKTVSEVDFVFAGEGEISFPEFIRLYSSGGDFTKISGLGYRANGRIFNNKAEIIKDISLLDFPWKLLNPLNYNKGELQGYTAKRRPVVTVVSSRGCPYRCTYCAQMSVFSYHFRVRDPINFVDEMEYLNKNFGIREIQLADDNFTFYRDHAVKVCNEILKRKLDVTWALINGVRIDKLDTELLKLMKKAGCYYMAFGLEFGSPRILAHCKKGLSEDGLKVGYENVKIASKMGFITHGFFLMGYPFEKEEDIDMTTALIKKLPLDRISIGMPIPYPGSEIFNYYMKNKFKSLDNINWDDYNEGNFKPIWEHLSGTTVATKIRKTYMMFYLNPVNMLRFLLKLRTLEQFKATFNGFRRGLLNTFLRIYTTK